MESNINDNKTKFTVNYSKRGVIIYLFFILFTLCIISIVVSIQFGARADVLRSIAEGNSNFRKVNEPAKRGNIYSSDNKLLSTTVTKYNIYMDFNPKGMTNDIFNNNVKELAQGLAKFFKNKSATQYEKELRGYRIKRLSYKKITPREINHQELVELTKLPLLNLRSNSGGKIVKTMHKRDNPYGRLAQRTIGRAPNSASNTQGAIGLELSFDKHLRGKDGISYLRKISGPVWVPDNNKEFIEPIDGNDIVTTIDIDLQDVAEYSLKNSLEKNKADWGTAILMEVETGEIKAIANISRNKNGEFFEDFNYAIGMSMEPGSTFKLVTLMSLLDEANVSINKKVDCGDGRMKVGPRYYTDTKRGLGELTLQQIFEKSSNIGFAKMVENNYGDNPQEFIDDIKDMGFLQKLDLQIKGEVQPYLRDTKDSYWDGTSLGMLSTGYSAILINPLRTLMIYNAIANDGKLISPLFVTKVTKNGKTIEEFKSKVLNNSICSNSTLKNVKKSMEGVIYDGTGALTLLNENYTIAGKTGTAQVLTDGKYRGEEGVHYFGSFAGYFPADKPKYSCIVAIKTYVPYRSGKRYGGATLAGPVFKSIADRVYAHAVDWGHEINKPVLDREERKKIERSIKNETKYTPKNVKEINSKINIVSKIGDLDKTKESINFLDIDESDITFTNGEKLDSAESISEDMETMPNIKGLGLQDVIEMFMPLGINVIPSGKGAVTWQSISKGKKLEKGSTLKITLRI